MEVKQRSVEKSIKRPAFAARNVEARFFEGDKVYLIYYRATSQLIYIYIDNFVYDLSCNIITL